MFRDKKKVSKLTLDAAVQTGRGGERPLRQSDKGATEDYKGDDLTHHSCDVNGVMTNEKNRRFRMRLVRRRLMGLLYGLTADGWKLRSIKIAFSGLYVPRTVRNTSFVAAFTEPLSKAILEFWLRVQSAVGFLDRQRVGQCSSTYFDTRALQYGSNLRFSGTAACKFRKHRLLSLMTESSRNSKTSTRRSGLVLGFGLGLGQ